MGTILYCYACDTNRIWLYSIHILLIVWQLSVNLIKIFLMCVAGKQWETLRFTIEVCSSRVLWLIAHYCVVVGIILIFRFLTIWSAVHLNVWFSSAIWFSFAMGTILYCYACDTNRIWLYSIHILLIVWQLSVNLIKIFLMCVAGKQWETLRFTIEVCSSRVLWLIAHYCAVAGIILIFRFLTIWSCTCRSCCQRLRPTVRPILHMGKWDVHEYQSSQETQKDC